MKAIAWISLAMAQGHTSASESRGLLPQKYTPEQFAEAQALAAELRERLTAEQVAEAERLAAELREYIEASQSQ